MAQTLLWAPLALALLCSSLGSCSNAPPANGGTQARLSTTGEPVAGARLQVDPNEAPVLTDLPLRLRKGGRISVRRAEHDDETPAYVFVSAIHRPEEVNTARFVDGIATLDRLQPDWTIVRVGLLQANELTLYDALVQIDDGADVTLDFAPAVERPVRVRIAGRDPSKHEPILNGELYAAFATLPDLRWRPSLRTPAPANIESLTQADWRSDASLLAIASPTLKPNQRLPSDFAPSDDGSHNVWTAPTPGSHVLAVRRPGRDGWLWRFEAFEVPDKDEFEFEPRPFDWRRR